ncbi:hypothetical protein RI054_24g103190 [Pseudoscourfieldia marina]
MLLQDCLAAAAAAALSTVTGVHPRAVARRGVRGATVELWNKKLLPSEESWDMEWKSSSLLTRCRCRLEELKVDRTGRQLRSADT